MFEQYEYGHLPPQPESVTVEPSDSRPGPDATSERETWTIRLKQGVKTLVLHASLTRPKGAPGPLAVVIRPNSYPGARPIAKSATSPAKAAEVPPDDAKLYLDAGIATLEFDLQEIAVDNKEQFASSGIHSLLETPIDAGALMAWAWGFHRMVDAVATDTRLDSQKIIVTGHSRYGKAALVAGAFDERIALTVPNHSGCGGASPYRFLYGKSESLPVIVGRFPHWFQRDLARFVGHLPRLAVDQHELRALVAPRGLLVTEGTKDAWCNPEGSQLAHRASAEVYNFLGVPDRVAIRFRPVAHVITSADVVEYAGFLFEGKSLPSEFNQLPYPEEQNGFSWHAPATKQAAEATPAP